jgi:hypothetical protein
MESFQFVGAPSRAKQSQRDPSVPERRIILPDSSDGQPAFAEATACQVDRRYRKQSGRERPLASRVRAGQATIAALRPLPH